MSYNIDTFKLKKVQMTLPKGFDIESFSDRAFAPIKVSSNLEDWGYNESGEGFEMKGEIEPNGFSVKEINCSGEGSGNDYDELLIPLFEKYKGNLEASMVWEGGDSLSKISIIDGEVKEEQIEV